MTHCGMDRVVVVLAPAAHSIILRGSQLLFQKLPLMILKYESVKVKAALLMALQLLVLTCTSSNSELTYRDCFILLV